MSDREIGLEVNAAVREPLRRIWRYIGYDEPNYTYTPNGKELLGKIGALSDSPYYMRCHFLLCTGDGTGRPKWGSTNAYTEDDEGNAKYWFDIVDKVLDAQIEAGCVPFVEIGFMPKALSTAPGTVQYDEIESGGWAYPPRDYSRWADLVRELARHCLERYGLREVSRWYWELWNEPNVMYWTGTTGEFCRLYDYTAWALHSVLPQALLGGPAIARPNQPGAGEFLEEFLDHCVHGHNAVTGETGTRLDVVTFHVKGSRYPADDKAAKHIPTIQYLLDHVKVGLEIIAKFPELKGLEVNLSECDPDGWAAGGKYDNPNFQFRNTEYYASYVANTVCRLIDFGADGPNRVDGMLTWAFQFEDREYFEGLRSLSTNGIDKAVLNVFRLLAKLGGTRIGLALDANSEKAGGTRSVTMPDGTHAYANLSAIAATDESGSIQLFVSDHHDDWDVHEHSTLKMRFHNLAPESEYLVKQWVVDRSKANGYSAWVAMGSPQQLSSQEKTVLQAQALVKPEKAGKVVTDANGSTEVRTNTVTHSITLLELTKVS